jgi:hypothetical protein
MNSKNISPDLWTDDRAYAIYLEHMEYHIDPLTSIQITTKVLQDLADEYECDVGKVFEVCSNNEIIQLIRERKLSPWILLKSRKFAAFLNKLSEEQLTILENMIDSNFWKKKFNNDPKTVSFVLACIKELEI